MSNLQAQDLSRHRWQDRLLLVLADEADAPLLMEQFQILQRHAEGLEERKMVLFELTPQSARIRSERQKEATCSTALYHSLKKTKAPFEVVLIGLDGGVKLRQNDLLTTEKLFALIDGMPMRRAEMRNKRTN